MSQVENILVEVQRSATHSLDSLHQYLSQATASNAPIACALICLELAGTYYYQGNDSLCLEYVEQCSRYLSGSPDCIIHSRILNIQGAVAYRRRHYDDAIRLFKRSFDLATTLESPLEKAMSAQCLSAVYCDTAQFQESLLQLQGILQHFDLHHLIEVEGGKGDVVCDSFYYDGYTFVRRPRDSRHLLVSCLSNLGNLYSTLGSEELAISEYSKALKLTSAAPGTIAHATILMQIGDCYKRRDENEDAEKFFLQSLQIFENLGVAGSLIAANYRQLANVRVRQKRYDEAEHLYRCALEAFIRVSDKFGEAETRLQLVEFHSSLQVQSSIHDLQHAENALALAQSVRSMETIVRAQLWIAKYHEGSNFKHALELYTNALLLAEEVELKREQCIIHKTISSFHKLYGDSSQALLHYEKYHRIEHEIRTASAEISARNLAILHEVERFKLEAQNTRTLLQNAENELLRKAQELAVSAKQILEKQEFIAMIEGGLYRVLESKPTDKDRLILDLLQSVRSGSKIDDDVAQFRDQFQGMQYEFVQKVSRLYPELSPAELKVCTLLRMNLRTKDIAEMLNLSNKTVENHRLHLRQKLGLDRDVNLVSAILELSSAI